MGIKKFLQSVFDPRVLAEETVNKQVEVYLKHRELFPNEEPHFHLAQTWRSRAAVNGQDPDDEAVQAASFIDTYQFACVPHPDCAKALGIFILYKERPDLLEQLTHMQEEFGLLMGPVHAAMEEGSIEELYREYNPKSASQM